MLASLIKLPVPIPADVLEQLKEIAASKEEHPYEFIETMYFLAIFQNHGLRSLANG